MYTEMDAFEWDTAKALSNARKHGVLFSTEAITVFDDDSAITISDRDSDPEEERFVSVGMSIRGRVIVVAYTYRGDRIRIISARRATAREREQYQEQS